MITVAQIHEIIKNVDPDIDVSTIEPSKRLRDYGLDSMDFFNVIIQLQELLGKEIPDEDIDQLLTVASIMEYLETNGA